MPGSRESIGFYWTLVEHFRREPGSWRMDFSVWSVRRPWSFAPRRLTLEVDFNAGLSDSTGRFMMTALVGVKRGPSAPLSRAAADALPALSERLQERRFSVRPPTPYFPLSAQKEVTPRSFAAEREFLSMLVASDPGVTVGRTPKSLNEFLDSFGGKSAGDWLPLLAAWEYRKPIHIAGRPATAILKVHVAPYARGVLGAASSVTIWPWSGTGAFPVWLRNSRQRLGRQFRAAGHKMEWFRGPRRRGLMITSMREDLRTLADVVRERRVLEAMPLGDEP